MIKYRKPGDMYESVKTFTYDLNADVFKDMKALISDMDSFIESLGDKFIRVDTWIDNYSEELKYEVVLMKYYTQEEIDSHNSLIDERIKKENRRNRKKEKARISAEAQRKEQKRIKAELQTNKNI